MSIKFEHKIQARVEDFELEPSVMVWDDIERNLPKKEKKRRLIFWWILPALLLVGGLSYWAMNDKQLDKEINITTTNSNDKIINNNNQNKLDETNTKQLTTSSKPQTITNEKQEKRNEKQELTKVEIVNNKTIEEPTPSSKLQTTSNEKRATRNEKQELTKDEIVNNKTIEELTPSSKPKTTSNKNQETRNEKHELTKDEIVNNKTNEQLTPNPKPQTITNEKQETRNEKQELTKDEIVSNKTVEPQTPNPKLQTIINEQRATSNENKVTTKSTWNYYVNFGRNSNRENIISESTKAADISNTQFSPPIIGSIPTANPSNLQSNLVTLPSNGLTFSAGISNITPVSKNIELEMYLGLKYRNAKSLVGSDSLSGDSQFFTPGLSTYRNHLWQAEVGLQLNTFINPKNKNKLFVTTGLSTTATLSSNWLTANSALNKYETYKNSTRFLLVNAQVGLGYKLQNGINFQLQIQQSFNTLNVTGIKNYFQTVELRTSVPFKYKNKKS